MKGSKLILPLVLFLFAVVQSHAQDGVVVHSDPRLSLLVKKQHSMEVTASSATPRKSKHNTAVVGPAADVPVPSVKATPSAKSTPGSKTASTSAPITNTLPSAPTRPEKKTPVKEASADASTTGYAAGWTPPTHRKARTVYSGKGFRVQIYNGPDRNKAIEVKTAFMRSYPGIRTYLTYVSPHFRVKVGDYKNRNEALGMLREASSIYTPCMIVPDLITISTF